MQMKAAGLTWDCALVDDGTLDTVIEVQPITPKRKTTQGVERYEPQTVRFSQEYATQIHVRTVTGKVLHLGLRHLCREAIDAYDAEVLPNDK